MSRKRFVGIWLILAMAMTINGITRETLLAPAIKRTPADILSAGLGLTLILGVTRPFLQEASLTRSQAARVGLLWAAMAVAFDFLVGHYVDAKNWSELAGNYAIWRGRLWPIVLSSVALAPIIWTRPHVPERDPAESA